MNNKHRPFKKKFFKKKPFHKLKKKTLYRPRSKVFKLFLIETVGKVIDNLSTPENLTLQDLILFKYTKRIFGQENELKSIEYLHSNKKLKQAVILNQITFKDVRYPFYLNLKLINEFLRKK